MSLTPIHIDRDLFALLENEAALEGITVESFAVKALRQYLWLREFRALRRALMRESDCKYTDEDIFELVS